MFDFVHENKRLVQIILLLLVLPFAVWGVSSYRERGGGDVATVDGEKVTQQEFDNALHQQEDQMRQMMRGAFDPALFDRPEIKQSILDSLVSQKLLDIGARSAGLTLSDEQVREVIQAYGAFQKNGKFDRKQYEEVLRRQNTTPAAFEARVKRDLAMRLLADTYVENGYASNAAADGLIRLYEQQRVVSVAQFSPDAFLGQAKVDEAALKSYYENNPQEFRTSEQARVEYVVFSAESLLPQATVNDKEIKDYYDEHKADFGEPEQRRAAHILIATPAQAADAAKQAARAKAEQVLAQVKKEPAKFAQFAKQYSNDPSAAKGGDLGFFGRGAMVKPFDDAAFGLKPGEISGVVQSDYGFHIIKLLEVKPAKTLPLDQVKKEIAQKLKLQKAGNRFAELADKFTSTVYEQSDSLKPAADLVKAPVQQSGWLSKGKPGALPWGDKALQAVFSDDVLKKKRNSAAVEIAPDTFLAVHLLEYKPAGTRSLAEVSGDIRQRLLRQRANELAVKEGQAMLARLQQGEKAAAAWKPAQTVTRAERDGKLDAGLKRLVLQADVGKLPVYVGTENPQGGYAVARIDAVNEAGAIDDAKRSSALQQLRQLTGEELLKDYLADARQHASVTMTKFSAGAKE